jgi:hypothetical protein
LADLSYLIQHEGDILFILKVYNGRIVDLLVHLHSSSIGGRGFQKREGFKKRTLLGTAPTPKTVVDHMVKMVGSKRCALYRVAAGNNAVLSQENEILSQDENPNQFKKEDACKLTC